MWLLSLNCVLDHVNSISEMIWVLKPLKSLSKLIKATSKKSPVEILVK